MGADLYINQLYEPQRQKWEPLFEKAARTRDRLPAGSEEHRRAQARVEECYANMKAEGYFRDSYNDWNLLWKFGLSWWSDVIPMLNQESELPVEAVKSLLAMLEERENVFQRELEALPVKEQDSFRRRHKDFEKFLKRAIDLNVPILASL